MPREGSFLSIIKKGSIPFGTDPFVIVIKFDWFVPAGVAVCSLPCACPVMRGFAGFRF